MSEVSDVVHNEAESRFELSVEGEIAKADYLRTGGNTLVFNRTLVPRSLRGHGLAAQLVRAGLDYARDEGFSVVPNCSYVARYIERHPEYGALVRD